MGISGASAALTLVELLFSERRRGDRDHATPATFRINGRITAEQRPNNGRGCIEISRDRGGLEVRTRGRRLSQKPSDVGVGSFLGRYYALDASRAPMQIALLD